MPSFFLHAASCIAAGGMLAFSAAAFAGPLDTYLPKGGVISGRVVTFSVAPEDEAISRQFRHAVQDNMDWFKKAVTSNNPNQPLPYDRRMGITQAQYEQLQHMKSEAHAGEAVKIEVRRASGGEVTLVPQNAASAALKDISFPPDQKSAETPVGNLSIFNEIRQKDVAAPIGVWNGVEWAEVATTDAKPNAKIAFGKREADGSGVMYYQVSPYADHKEQSIVVFYAID